MVACARQKAEWLRIDPDADGCNLDGGEGGGPSVIVGGPTAHLRDAAEDALGAVALAIGSPAEGEGALAHRPRRHVGPGTPRGQEGSDAIGVVGLVRDHGRTGREGG